MLANDKIRGRQSSKSLTGFARFENGLGQGILNPNPVSSSNGATVVRLYIIKYIYIYLIFVPVPGIEVLT